MSVARVPRFAARTKVRLRSKVSIIKKPVSIGNKALVYTRATGTGYGKLPSNVAECKYRRKRGSATPLAQAFSAARCVYGG